MYAVHSKSSVLTFSIGGRVEVDQDATCRKQEENVG